MYPQTFMGLAVSNSRKLWSAVSYSFSLFNASRIASRINSDSAIELRLQRSRNFALSCGAILTKSLSSLKPSRDSLLRRIFSPPFPNACAHNSTYGYLEQIEYGKNFSCIFGSPWRAYKICNAKGFPRCTMTKVSYRHFLFRSFSNFLMPRRAASI